MIPIGGIIAVLPVLNDLNVPVALTDVAANSGFQLCDGSVVNDPESPLNGFKLPDLRQRQLQAASSAGQYIETQIGSSAIAFSEDCFESQGEYDKILEVQVGAELTQNPMVFARYYMRIK